MIHYDNKTFRSISNSESGEVDGETLFHYQQEGKLVSATYAGGSIVFGHLIALVDEKGELDMRYHHLNLTGEIRTGICHSIPELLPDGRIRLHESWCWTNGDASAGTSIIEEV